jgi:hypothetical protein
VVVFCLAFVAADADAAGPDCSGVTNPSDMRELCLLQLDALVRPDDPGTTPDDERAPWLQLIDSDLTNAFAGLPGVNNKVGNLADQLAASLDNGGIPRLIETNATLADISYDVAEVHSNTNGLSGQLDSIIGGNFEGLGKVNNQLSNIYDSSIDSGITNPSKNQPGWLTLHDDLVVVHDDLRDVVDAIDAQGPNGSLTGPSGDDADPVRVQLASSETQLADAANAGLGALWFLAGLLVVVVVAGAIRKALMPS